MVGEFWMIMSIASMAGATLGSKQAEPAADSKKTVDKRSLWQLGSYYSGFGDSLARSDDGHGASFSGEQQHFGGGWHQEYQPAVQHQQQQHHQWAQVQSVPEHESKAHPVHEWQAEHQSAGHQSGQGQHHFLADHVPQHHFGGSFEQPKHEQPSFDWHHQQLHQGAGISQGWQHDEAKEVDAGHGGHSEWAPIAVGSTDLHKEHSVQSVSSETKEHQHQEWAPAEGKEHHEEHHHHTKIIKVPYPVHIEKPYPVYIEKPFIVEKPVPLKLYIKKKHH
uniref:Uncharacterized protein n=1 Tax=Anopheles atroparvus TaxID=41427 RepID=A0A182J182_ANOAO